MISIPRSPAAFVPTRPAFLFKLVLLNRIKWFAGRAARPTTIGGSVDQNNEDPPTIRYISREEAMRSPVSGVDPGMPVAWPS